MAPDGNRERFNRNMLPGGSDFWKLGVGGSCFLYYQLKFKLPELLPLPKKSEREKGQILLSPLLPPGGPPIPIFYGKGRCLSTQQPIFQCFQYFPSSETLPSQCRRNCSERFIWEADVVEVAQAIGTFQ